MNWLIYPCAFHHLWDSLSAYEYMREHGLLRGRVPEIERREKEWYNRSEFFAEWILDAALELDTYNLPFTKKELVTICGMMETIGDAFIFRFTDELSHAAREASVAGDETQAATLLYYFYCKAVIETIGRFDRLLLETPPELASFKAYCVENRHRWLDFARLMDKELDGLNGLSSVASDVRPAMLATAHRMADMWESSVQQAVEQVQHEKGTSQAPTG